MKRALTLGDSSINILLESVPFKKIHSKMWAGPAVFVLIQHFHPHHWGGVGVRVGGGELGAMLQQCYLITAVTVGQTHHPGMLINGLIVRGSGEGAFYVRLGPDQFLQGNMSQNLQCIITCGSFKKRDEAMFRLDDSPLPLHFLMSVKIAPR